MCKGLMQSFHSRHCHKNSPIYWVESLLFKLFEKWQTYRQFCNVAHRYIRHEFGSWLPWNNISSVSRDQCISKWQHINNLFHVICKPNRGYFMQLYDKVLGTPLYSVCWSVSDDYHASMYTTNSLTCLNSNIACSFAADNRTSYSARISE